MASFRIALLLCFGIFGTTVYAQKERKVMVIGIDGCRADALVQANTPNIDALLGNALYSLDTWHVGITISGPSWSSIMCGVREDKHGVTNNSYAGSNYNDYPYFPTRAKEIKPDLYCVQVTEWSNMTDLVYNDGWDKKILAPDGQGIPTVDSAWIELDNPDLDCIFVYFDRVDLAGHTTGFSPTSSTYMNAIEFTDSCVGLLIDSLRSRPTYAQEDWLILLITDHGGIFLGHGGQSDDERKIWWIASGDAVEHRKIIAPDPGSYELSSVDTTITDTIPLQTDIAVTALHHLIYSEGINPEDRTDWELDGKSWLKSTSGISTPQNNLGVSVYPNPSTGMFQLVLHNPAGPMGYMVTDVTGKIVQQADNLAPSTKLNIDLSTQPAGTYLLHVQAGQQNFSGELMIIK